MEVLQGRIDRTDAALEDAYGAEDEDKAEALHQRREALVAELEALQSALVGHAPEVRAMAGAILTVDREGQAMVHRGLLREAEAKALRTLEKLRQGGAGQGAEGTIAGNGDDAAPEAAHGVSNRLASLRWHWPRWFMAWFGRCCKAHCTGRACRWACAWKCRTGWPR